MALTPQGVPTSPGLTYVNVARSLPFQYTFRGDDFTEFSPATRDLFENRDRELELKLIDIGGSIPVGGVTMFAGLKSAIPYNYLPCDSRILNTTEFADLFNVIGYRYGGSGVNFVLPDSQGFFPFGLTANTDPVSGGQSTGPGDISLHSHDVNSTTQSSGHSHALNSHSSTGHTHTLGASTGNGGVDHFHGGNTAGQSAQHTHSYQKPNTGTFTNTGGYNTDHTHSFTTGLATSFNHAHNAAANVNATNADTGHSHTASTTNADTAHTHTLTAVTGTTSHTHVSYYTGFYFIIRYQ